MLKDQIIKLRDEANKNLKIYCNSEVLTNQYNGEYDAYNTVLELIDKEPKDLFEECLLLAKVFKAMVKTGSPADIKADEIIKKLEEVIK